MIERDPKYQIECLERELKVRKWFIWFLLGFIMVLFLHFVGHMPLTGCIGGAWPNCNF